MQEYNSNDWICLEIASGAHIAFYLQTKDEKKKVQCHEVKSWQI